MSALCRACGKPIVWGVTTEGKRVPLDPRSPVYESIEPMANGGLRVARTRAAFVLHFATCPRVDVITRERARAGDENACDPAEVEA